MLGQFRAGTLGIGELFRFFADNVLARYTLSADREFIFYLKGRLTIQQAAA